MSTGDMSSYETINAERLTNVASCFIWGLRRGTSLSELFGLILCASSSLLFCDKFNKPVNIDVCGDVYGKENNGDPSRRRLSKLERDRRLSKHFKSDK